MWTYGGRRSVQTSWIMDYAVTAFNGREELSSEVNAGEGGPSFGRVLENEAVGTI